MYRIHDLLYAVDFFFIPVIMTILSISQVL
nr:MAG TPA: hypothetical protein [Caudoviricetes sp.]